VAAPENALVSVTGAAIAAVVPSGEIKFRQRERSAETEAAFLFRQIQSREFQ